MIACLPLLLICGCPHHAPPQAELAGAGSHVAVHTIPAGQAAPPVPPSPEARRIRRVLDGLHDQAGACYLDRLEASPELYGELVFRIEIGAGGQVGSARPVLDTAGDSGLSDCIRAAVLGLRFPRLDKAITVSYPFVLTSDRTPPEVVRAMLIRHGLLDPDQEPVAPGRDNKQPAGQQPTGWWASW